MDGESVGFSGLDSGSNLAPGGVSDVVSDTLDDEPVPSTGGGAMGTHPETMIPTRTSVCVTMFRSAGRQRSVRIIGILPIHRAVPSASRDDGTNVANAKTNLNLSLQRFQEREKRLPITVTEFYIGIADSRGFAIVLADRLVDRVGRSVMKVRS